MNRPKCQVCKQGEAIWAMQYIASDKPSFYALGHHIRGWHVTKVCDECQKEVQDKYEAYRVDGHCAERLA